MPMPVVEPMPLPPVEVRLSVPLEAHEASYLAASASISSFCLSSIWVFMIGTSNSVMTLMQPFGSDYYQFEFCLPRKTVAFLKNQNNKALKRALLLI